MRKLPYPNHTLRFKPGFKCGIEAGFALIATISVMALVIMIAMAMVSLSTSVVRTSQHGRAMEVAQANARMALVLAIGKLQQEMGPDQRISANANILDNPNTSGINEVINPHWTGIWDSWKAGTDENSQHSTIGDSDEMAPTYLPNDQPNRSDHFRNWLLSLNPGEALDVSLPINLTLDGKLKPSIADTDIRLVGAGSLGSYATREKDYVSARLLSITDAADSSKTVGRYGWWVGDESQKARLISDSYQNGTLTAADKIFRSQAPASMGSKTTPGLENMSDEQELAKVVSHKTLDLLGLDTPLAVGDLTVAERNFHIATIHSKSVLADVREGGLKRDLSTILEQPIRLEDNGPEYILYELDDPRFSDRSNSRVPIQDLAAYHQLYYNDPNWSEGRRGGISYNSTALPNSIQATTPDYDGGTGNRAIYQREYSALYKQPVIAKVQFLIAIGAQEVTDEERQHILEKCEERDRLNNDGNPRNNSGFKGVPMRPTDTHKLLLGIMPVVTLWNPNNVPMVMDSSQVLRFNTPPFALRWRKYRPVGPIVDNNYEPYDFLYFNLNYSMGGSTITTGVTNGGNGNLINYRFAKNSSVAFEPGEVKMFSAPSNVGGTLSEIDGAAQFSTDVIDAENSWDPNGLFIVPRATPVGSQADEAPEAYNFNMIPDTPGDYWGANYAKRETLVFKADDKLTLEIISEKASPHASGRVQQQDGRRVSFRNEVLGAGFVLSMVDEGFYHGTRKIDFMRNYHLLSRHGGEFYHTTQMPQIEIDQAAFNQELIRPAFPGGVGLINFKDATNSLPCSVLINASAAKEYIGLMDFSFSYGCEAGSNNLAGFGGGRRVVSRPFLHSGLNAAPFIDKIEKTSLYNSGFDWQLNPINNIEDSIVQGELDTGRGYFGGGYTVEAGTTHVVQREIPVLPPISVAALSHAHLGGFSLARNNTIGDNPDTDNFVTEEWDRAVTNRVRVPVGTDYQQITATGQGGLAPHVVQAIGNSYAHPNIPANKAFITDWERYFDANEEPKNVPFVDHSYLANKALWDEYFFSSISPQPSSVELYGTSARTVQEVASGFFNNDASLPNRRIIPHRATMSSEVLDDLFTQYGTYSDGFADKIAAHLMVNGGFNINSTSKDAWKVLFSSLKGKPSVYLESGKSPAETSLEGTVVSYGSLPAAEPIVAGSIISSPNTPPEQWKAGRELSDDDIDKLATAMVKQVKLRGPFLSLSEFINRRLDGSNEEFALKGALQAAIDDPTVLINAQFREPGRMLDGETATIDFAFDAAADGPIAYGSAAYVDQADILRGLAGQLTPRGDTFVIRAYGDSIGKDGEVLARAWCEAVVQRMPEYIDSIDEPHVKFADLSDVNKRFGRQLKIISFRWLNAGEI